LTNYGLKH